MTNRFNLPDITFFDKSPDTIVSEMLQHINDKTGLEFQRSDPRRKFVESLATFVSFERNRAEHALKQNLLAYATDDMLDLKGDELDTPRLIDKAATTIIGFNLETARGVALPIPQGTRVKIAEVYFQTTKIAVVPIDVSYIELPMTCTETGEIGNDYLPGETVTLVDPLPYVKSVVNTVVSAGGAEMEEDDPYAERIRLAPEKFSVAGPDLAYKYFALTSSQDIADVEVDSPAPGVTRIVALLKNGEIPTQQHLDEILAICSAESVRPLTDNVIATIPEVQNFNLEVQYWLPNSKATVADELMQKIDAEYQTYLVWQRSKLGRDVNPSEVVKRLKITESEKLAERVEVIGVSYTEIDKTKIAVAEDPKLTFMGFIDD
ncbi:baseplate J/gp47 family protein [Lysinibacillus sphaericus]|uniref:baseplate J/gp47 family protein n=1 Tax=Lysinibacillus sphaericus TaxID=1421 RepID=UPI0018CE384E|nr:baseplate J/gp47 family protein [Lysinibacillus sphaericus]